MNIKGEACSKSQPALVLKSGKGVETRHFLSRSSKLEIYPLLEKSLNRQAPQLKDGGDESPQRRPNRSLRATGSRVKTRAKNWGRTRISPVEEQDKATTAGKRS